MVPKSIRQWDFPGSVGVEHLPHGSVKVQICLHSCRRFAMDMSSKTTSRVCLSRSLLVSLVRQPPPSETVPGSVLVPALAGGPVSLRDACF